MNHLLHFHIHFASRTRLAHFEKSVSMPAIPRMGESVQFSNPDTGEFDSWLVTQIVHKESGAIEIWTAMLDNHNNQMYSFEFEEQFDEYYSAFFEADWHCALGPKPNVLYSD